MLTNKAKYSLRAMCALTALPAGGRLQAHAIAERTNVPVGDRLYLRPTRYRVFPAD